MYEPVESFDDDDVKVPKGKLPHVCFKRTACELSICMANCRAHEPWQSSRSSEARNLMLGLCNGCTCPSLLSEGTDALALVLLYTHRL